MIASRALSRAAAAGVLALTLAITLALPGPAAASALEVTPILTDIVTDASGATTITIRNRAASPATVQLRLLRWFLENGEDRTEPTTTAAVSPPFITLQPGAIHVVRIVRISRQPIAGEEAYRLLLDELPEAGTGNVTIALAVRHVLPVFFRNAKARPPSVRWAITGSGDATQLVATNTGERRMRVARLQLEDKAGHRIDLGEGLAGYALGGGERRWRMPADPSFDFAHATVRFRSEAGSETAEATLLDRARP